MNLLVGGQIEICKRRTEAVPVLFVMLVVVLVVVLVVLVVVVVLLVYNQ